MRKAKKYAVTGLSRQELRWMHLAIKHYERKRQRSLDRVLKKYGDEVKPAFREEKEDCLEQIGVLRMGLEKQLSLIPKEEGEEVK
jgi:hypothetical protein